MTIYSYPHTMQELDEETGMYTSFFDVRYIMADTNLSNSGVRAFLKRHGFKPSHTEAGISYYDGEVLDAFHGHQAYRFPKPEALEETLKHVQSYEERITQLEGIVKSLESKAVKTFVLFNRIGKHSPQLIANREE